MKTFIYALPPPSDMLVSTTPGSMTPHHDDATAPDDGAGATDDDSGSVRGLTGHPP